MPVWLPLNHDLPRCAQVMQHIKYAMQDCTDPSSMQYFSEAGGVELQLGFNIGLQP